MRGDFLMHVEFCFETGEALASVPGARGWTLPRLRRRRTWLTSYLVSPLPAEGFSACPQWCSHSDRLYINAVERGVLVVPNGQWPDDLVLLG